MEIRDNRAKEWFWLDNEYLNGYAKHLGISCTGVYLSLCRHADNNTQQCFPSMKLISEELGISTKTVERATKKLEQWGILAIKRAKKEDGTQANNVYTLTSKKLWKNKPTDIESHGKTEKPTDKNDENRQTPRPYNKTHINNTHKLLLTQPSVFSFEEELQKLKDNDRKDLKIIALYWKKKDWVFENKKQFEAALRRELLPAKALTGYTGEQVARAMKYCQDNYLPPIEWKLETVHKVISSLVNKK